ncbi:MAG TPA: glycosyltransferase family 39 protein [Candidatus Acidoferrum sp.]|nr:glycosyltransferase family 39 protein [Candidatus Acidoferrum sp.]
MAQTCTELPASPPLSPAARLLWLVLIAATLYLCYFQNLGALGLVGPDEPRYAWIARDMQESGDYITPRLYGKPWFEKPPLYYWSAALSFKLFGVSETSARLPSAISALLATLALAWLALRLYGAETARWLLLLLPTTVGMIGFSHAAATDMPFAAMLTIAMVFATKLLNLVPSAPAPLQDATTPAGRFRSFTSFTSSTSFTSFLFGFFLGLATLAKGPAALILSGGAIFLWAIFTKRWRDAFRCLHPVAIASFCLTALPWYILCARRNPDFFRVFIIEHNFNRFLTPEFQHIQPFWYYIPILLIAFLPWTPLLLISAAFGGLKVWQERKLSPANWFLLFWSLFCLLFFSLSKSKLPGYILPGVPAIGVLMARSLPQPMPLFAKYFRWFLALTGAVLAVTSLFSLAWGILITSPQTATRVRDIALVLAFLALANLILAFYRANHEPRFPIAAWCLLPVLLLAACVPRLLPAIFPYDPSGKTLAAEITSTHLPSDVYVGPISRGEYFSLNFYLHRELKEWDKSSPKEGYLLLRSRACRSELEPGWKCTDEPVALPKSGWFIYRVQPDPSLGGLGGSNTGSKLGNLQPR